MNDDLQTFIEPELEARLVALILGEASAFEEEELDRILKERPEVALARQRLEEVHGLVGQAIALPEDDDQWKLSSQRREKVLAVLGEGSISSEGESQVKERRISIAQWRSIYATAACLMVAMVVLALVAPINRKYDREEIAELVSYSAREESLEEDILEQEAIVADYEKSLAVIELQDEIPRLDAREEPSEERSEKLLHRSFQSRLDVLENKRSSLQAKLNKHLDSGNEGETRRNFDRDKLVSELQQADQKMANLDRFVDGEKDATVKLSVPQDQFDSIRGEYLQAKGKLDELKRLSGSEDVKSGSVSSGYRSTQADPSGIAKNYLDAIDAGLGVPTREESEPGDFHNRRPLGGESLAVVDDSRKLKPGSGRSLYGRPSSKSGSEWSKNTVAGGERRFRTANGKEETGQLDKDEKAADQPSNPERGGQKKSDHWGYTGVASNRELAGEAEMNKRLGGIQRDLIEDFPETEQLVKSRTKKNLDPEESKWFVDSFEDQAKSPVAAEPVPVVSKPSPTKKPNSSSIQGLAAVPAETDPAAGAKAITARSVSSGAIIDPKGPVEPGATVDFGTEDGGGFGGAGAGGGILGGGVAGKKDARRSNNHGFTVTPATPVPTDEAGESNQPQADPFAWDDGEQALSFSRDGKVIDGGLNRSGEKSHESGLDHSSQRRKAMLKEKIVDLAEVRSVDVNGVASIEGRVVEGLDVKEEAKVESEPLAQKENRESLYSVSGYSRRNPDGLSKDRRLLDLDVDGPDVKDFEGFVDYGEPIAKADKLSESQGKAPGQVFFGAATGGAQSEYAYLKRDKNTPETDAKGKAFLKGQGRTTVVTKGENTRWGSKDQPEVKAPKVLDEAPSGDLAGQEMIRRREAVRSSDELLLEGRKLYAQGDYESAVQKYRASLDTLPSGAATADRREVFKQHLQDGSVALSQQHRRVGEYDEARKLLEEVAAADPGSEVAAKGLEYLDDPIRTNPSVSYENSKNVDKIRRNLYKGNGYYDLGLYDKAEEEFKEVLRTDPYNKAARRWLEKTASIKSDYYRAAYDETRSRMLMEVDKAWELAVPPIDSVGLGVVDDGLSADSAEVGTDVGRSVTIAAKPQQIVIPKVDFRNTTLDEALDFLRIRSIELDVGTLDERHKGINFVLRSNADGESLGQKKIKALEMEDATVTEVLEELRKQAGLEIQMDEWAIVLKPESEKDGKWTPEIEGDSVSKEAGSKLATTYLPVLDFNNTTLNEGLEFLNIRSQELSDSETVAVEFTFEDDSLGDLVVDQLYLSRVPLNVAAKYLAEKTGTRYRIKEGKVVFYSDRPIVKKQIDSFETLTSEKSDSTFSLNVSDVSFKLAKSSLSEGKWPESSKVRPEEFVNALDYDDRKPSQSEKVACEIEQGTHPFMQQRNLMRVSMSTAALGRNAMTPLRLTILLDQSGSMERADRAESVKRAFALLTAQLNAGDEVTLVGFARTPRLLAERVKGNESGKLLEIVSRTLTEGGTNLEGALASGIQLAKQQYVAGAQNRIILLTDGAANLGDALPENLAKQVEQMRQADIAFDACGVGADGLNDDILSSLAKQGDGRYYFLDRPEDADEGFARQIAGALRPAAKNVKVQVIFNPDRVSKFKLYGYEKHLLKKEDFRNDTVDAAEMAAEESGVALYHFEADPDGEGDVGYVSVRFLDTATDRMVERTWPIPYEENVSGFSEADPALRLASTAALFAEKLKGSAVGERVQLKQLRKELDALQGTYQHQRRFQEFRTMLQQAGE